MVNRRSFLGLAAGIPAAFAPSPPTAATSVRRTGPVEVAFKSPTPRPNGLQATAEGLWIIDQGPGSRASLVRYSDGEVLRSFETDTVRPSGITFDGQTLWIGSTFSYENVRCDATTGAVLERRPTPGCTTFTMAGDPAPRRSPLAPPPTAAASATSPVAPPAVRLSQAPHGRFQGAHGQEWRNGRLWTTATCARSIFEVDPAAWVVQRRFTTPGPRPHGLAWEGRYLWHGDGDLNAFFKYDPDTGHIVETIQLKDNDPLAHGLSIWEGTLWYCDDIGVVCRMKI